MDKAAAGKYLAYVDGLRALAATYVVFHHAALQLVARNASLPVILRWVVRFSKYGHSAVALFIILSGFCLMIPVTNQGELRDGAWKFFQKRARRILPPYFFALAISLLLGVFWVDNAGKSLLERASPITIKDVLMHVFLLQDLFVEEAAKINVVLWSVSVEWRLSLVFPLILLIWKHWGAWRALILFLVTSYLGQYLLRYTPFNRYGWGVCVHFVGLFCLGMMACECAFSKSKDFSNLRARVPWRRITPMAFVIAAFVLLEVRQLPFYVSDFFIGVWICCLLISLSGDDPPLSRQILSWRPLVFGGTFAYSIYLIHAPVLQLVFRYLVKPMHLDIAASISLILVVGPICSLIAAYGFFRCFERPFLARRKARVDST